MKKVSIYFIAILFAGFFTSCNNDDEVENSPITQQDAITKAMQMTSATLISSTTKTNGEGITYYEVEVQTDSGAIIEFEYFELYGELKSIEGDSGPFDYEVNPGMGLIKFSSAKSNALEAQPGEVLRWSLIEDSPEVWLYTFEILNINGEEFTVEINALTGELI